MAPGMSALFVTWMRCVVIGLGMDEKKSLVLHILLYFRVIIDPPLILLQQLI